LFVVGGGSIDNLEGEVSAGAHASKNPSFAFGNTKERRGNKTGFFPQGILSTPVPIQQRRERTVAESCAFGRAPFSGGATPSIKIKREGTHGCTMIPVTTHFSAAQWQESKVQLSTTIASCSQLPLIRIFLPRDSTRPRSFNHAGILIYSCAVSNGHVRVPPLGKHCAIFPPDPL